MYPLERSLVQRLNDKPFALIGVNSDPDKDVLKKRLTEEKITWRSFWNGPEGPGGPVSRAWNVRAWPTVYVLDHKGVIRFKHGADKELEKAIDDLVKEASKDGK